MSTTLELCQCASRKKALLSTAVSTECLSITALLNDATKLTSNGEEGYEQDGDVGCEDCYSKGTDQQREGYSIYCTRYS